MRTKSSTTMRFVRLDSAMRQLGARTQKAFLRDLHGLSDRERRDAADLVKKGG